MKKLALTVLAAVVATVGMVSAASADSRNRGDDEWRNRGDHHADRNDDNWRHGDRDRNWRHHGWRHDDWRRHHNGPRIVYRNDFRDDYCFVKKVRRYDDWGNVYIKRVRICR